MEIIQSIILGIIQGASEFLPISSSGHLILAPWFFGWKDEGLFFSVALHFGTLIAVVLYFWKDWLEIFNLAISKKYKSNSYEKSILWILVIATIPGVIAGLLLEEMAETVFRNPLLVSFNLFFWGLILFLVDKYSKKKKTIKNIGFKDGILVGLSQALAIIPGTSRSGITMTTGLLRGLDRVSTARFSFLMLTPIVFGASLLELQNFIDNFNFVLVLGVAFSAFSGYLAIKYLIKLVEKVSYQIFFWYRLLLALIIVLMYFL